ncbi:hypothetical protein D3C71_1815900 [compost metagenome]
MRLDRSLVIGVDFQSKVLTRNPFLENVGAAADQFRGDILAERFESLFGNDPARSISERDRVECRCRLLQDDAAFEGAGDLDAIKG